MTDYDQLKEIEENIIELVRLERLLQKKKNNIIINYDKERRNSTKNFENKKKKIFKKTSNNRMNNELELNLELKFIEDKLFDIYVLKREQEQLRESIMKKIYSRNNLDSDSSFDSDSSIDSDFLLFGKRKNKRKNKKSKKSKKRKLLRRY